MNVYTAPGIPVIRPHHTADKIVEVVCDYFHITEKEIKATGRQRVYAEPRQIAMYLMCELTTMSLKDIGERFSGRDHTTVINARTVVRDFLQVDPKYKVYISDIKYLLEKN